MKQFSAVLSLLAASASILCGQAPDRVLSPNVNGWYMYFGDHPLGKSPWGIHLEGQWRRNEVITKWQQSFLRPAVNYEVNPSVMVTGGYAFADTFRYGDFPAPERFPEHRIFEQLLLRQNVGRTGLQHRYRLEQRYIGEMSRTPGGERQVDRWRYENRFRYQLRAAVPLRGRTITEGTWYLAGYNEVFVNFGKNVAANVFDQNRAYLALGHGLTKSNRLEIGYLNQLIQQRNGRIFELNHTLQVAFFSSFRFGGD